MNIFALGNSGTEYLYGPDDYFLFSDIENGDNICPIGYRISIYRVLPYNEDHIHVFDFTPTMYSFGTKIERLGDKGGKIIVADSDEVFKNRSDLIKSKASKHYVSYFEPNAKKINKELVEANRTQINDFYEDMKRYNIRVTPEDFGFSILSDCDYDEEDNFIGDSFMTVLGCVVKQGMYGAPDYYTFPNCIPIMQGSEYLYAKPEEMNCYVLELVDTCTVSIRKPENIDNIRRIEILINKLNFGSNPVDNIHTDINDFFELKKCGIPYEFLFQFMPNECIFQITPLCIFRDEFDDCEIEVGPLYGSNEIC